MSNVVIIPRTVEDIRIGSVFNNLFLVFEATDAVEEDEVIWDFSSSSYFHPFFICPLAIFRSNYQKIIRCINIPSNVSGYFDFIYFDRLLKIDQFTDYESKLNPYLSKTYIPICELKLRGLDTDKLQSFIQRIHECPVKIRTDYIKFNN